MQSPHLTRLQITMQIYRETPIRKVSQKNAERRSKPFKDRELKTAIKQQKNTELTGDTIQHQTIKSLPQETLKSLLDMYNRRLKKSVH